MNKTTDPKQIALITGSAKRIGKEMVIYLAKNGWDLALHYNNSLDEVNELVTTIKDCCNIFTIQTDFNNLEKVEDLIQEVNKNFGQVSLLINNAASFHKDYFDNFDIGSLQKNMNVNFLAPSILIKNFYNQFRFNKALDVNIINIIDYSIHINSPNYYTYSLAKKALADLTKHNAPLLAPNIRINAIAPGYVIPSETHDIDDFVNKTKNSPLKTSTSIDEILQTIDYILKSKSLTGEIITLDGGKRFVNSGY